MNRNVLIVVAALIIFLVLAGPQAFIGSNGTRQVRQVTVTEGSTTSTVAGSVQPVIVMPKGVSFKGGIVLYYGDGSNRTVVDTSAVPATVSLAGDVRNVTGVAFVTLMGVAFSKVVSSNTVFLDVNQTVQVGRNFTVRLERYTAYLVNQTYGFVLLTPMHFSTSSVVAVSHTLAVLPSSSTFTLNHFVTVPLSAPDNSANQLHGGTFDTLTLTGSGGLIQGESACTNCGNQLSQQLFSLPPTITGTLTAAIPQIDIASAPSAGSPPNSNSPPSVLSSSTATASVPNNVGSVASDWTPSGTYGCCASVPGGILGTYLKLSNYNPAVPTVGGYSIPNANPTPFPSSNPSSSSASNPSNPSGGWYEGPPSPPVVVGSSSDTFSASDAVSSIDSSIGAQQAEQQQNQNPPSSESQESFIRLGSLHTRMGWIRAPVLPIQPLRFDYVDGAGFGRTVLVNPLSVLILLGIVLLVLKYGKS